MPTRRDGIGDFKDILLETNFHEVCQSFNIETSDLCNRRCWFCPNATFEKQPGFMSQEIFEKILDDLKTGGYKGRVCLYQRGEPLLDPRLVEWTRLTREALPENLIHISTNGDFLTRKIAHSLLDAGMTEILVCHYDEVRVPLMRELSHLVKVFHHNKTSTDTPDGHWFNRGGKVPVPNAEGMKMEDGLCWWVFRKAGITCDGEYMICCADWFAKSIGNIKDHTINELWNSHAMRSFRTEHYHGMAKSLEHCKDCNVLDGND